MGQAAVTRAALGRAKARLERARRQAGSNRATVSIVIPCYNYGHYVERCVSSVLDQADVDVNVLIIDDASTDGSAEVVRCAAHADARVRAICHRQNMGHIGTYNEGLSQATAEYTVLLSADDLLAPGALARATALMDAHPSTGLVYGFCIDFTGPEPPSARTEACNWAIWRGHDWLAYRCKIGRNALRSPEALVRTSVLRDIGGYRTDLPHSGDFEMWMRIATISDVGYIAGADQAYYRLHENNMHHSRYDQRADVSERLRAFDIIFAERSSLVPNAVGMRAAAHRAIAREALGHAISACVRGVSSRELLDGYADIAVKAWPGVDQLPEWRLLRKLRRLDGNQIRRDPSIVAREFTRNVTFNVRWWRRRLSGI